jgi:thiol-disulfide isomerase/thioredoxin
LPRSSAAADPRNIDAFENLVPHVGPGLWVLAATIALTVVVGLLLRSRRGRFRAADEPAPTAADPARPALTSADLEASLGERATLVHFSSAFCAPCRATRQVLTQVSAAVPGVDHVEVDAESHLDLVRRLGIRRTPTVLVLDPAGRIRARASGLPHEAEVHAALEGLVSQDDVP